MSNNDKKWITISDNYTDDQNEFHVIIHPDKSECAIKELRVMVMKLVDEMKEMNTKLNGMNNKIDEIEKKLPVFPICLIFQTPRTI